MPRVPGHFKNQTSFNALNSRQLHVEDEGILVNQVGILAKLHVLQRPAIFIDALRNRGGGS